MPKTTKPATKSAGILARDKVPCINEEWMAELIHAHNTKHSRRLLAAFNQ
jgi:hypothetical protein